MKNTHGGVLILLLKWTLLHGCFTMFFYYQTEETNFSFFCKVSTNGTVEFGNRCFFKDINFYGHEFFRTVSDSCLRVPFISSNKNHKPLDDFSFIFSISIKISLWFSDVAFLKFSENCNKETAWWGLYFVKPQAWGGEKFFEEFSGIPRTNN